MINVLASKTEALFRDIFVKFQRRVAMQPTLSEIVHNQLPITSVTDSVTGDGFLMTTPTNNIPAQLMRDDIGFSKESYKGRF